MWEQQIIGWIITLFFLILIALQVRGIKRIHLFQYFPKLNWAILGVVIVIMTIILVQVANIFIHYFILLLAIISLLLLPRVGGINEETVIHTRSRKMVPIYTPLSNIKWIKIYPSNQKYKVLFILENITIYMDFSEEDYYSLIEIVRDNDIQIKQE